MPIPLASQAAPAPPAHGEYNLEDRPERELMSFQAAPRRRSEPQVNDQDFQPTQKKRRKRSQSRRKHFKSLLTQPRNLVIAASVVGLVALIAAFVPAVRAPIGVALALPGVLLCLYGYASGAYIAFTEDDLHGWLYLLFPFYAAYYLVSRWDEMSSRLIMVVLGLVLCGIGGKMLEGEVERALAAKSEAAANG
jgi:hypothetical protein